MANSNRITALSSIIASNSSKIDSFLVANNLPTPSFDVDVPPYMLLHPEIAGARKAILEATDEMTSLVSGPIGILTNQTTFASLSPIQRFGLANSFEKEATFEEIAASTSKLSEDQVKRIIRHAITYGIFQEPRKGVVAHTAASKLLAQTPLMSQWIGMVADEMWCSTTRMADAMSKWGDSGDPAHAGFTLAHNTETNAFDELAKFPDRMNRYAAAMTWFSNGPGFEVSHVVNGYGWDQFKDGIVVDVGGSFGNACIALAEKFPSLRYIVQDVPKVVEMGKSNLPANLQDKITFMEHDFFTEQPIKGASVYFLRYILHDWSDPYAIRILKALVPAMRPGSKVLLNEHVIPEPGTMSYLGDRHFRNFDIAMWELHNGKERDRDDWVKLLNDADPRFKLSNVKQPVGSNLGIVEIDWEDTSKL